LILLPKLDVVGSNPIARCDINLLADRRLATLLASGGAAQKAEEKGELPLSRSRSLTPEVPVVSRRLRPDTSAKQRNKRIPLSVSYPSMRPP